MPELPEVETLRRGLEQKILHRTISGVEVANPKVLKGQAEDQFRERVTGRRVEQIARRGKYLLITLGRADAASDLMDATPSPLPYFLCLHLKMRGQVRVQSQEEAVGPYHCISLFFDDQAMRFYDMWTWGEMRALTHEEVQSIEGLRVMGPEPLADGWDGALLAGRLKSKRTAIKPTLLDQAVIAGVGNIYADEALFRAGIHPQRRASELNAVEIMRLAGTIRQVLTEAVAAGGTTSEEFVDAEGQMGRFRPQVYDRGGQPCLVCGNGLTRIRLGGRGTVFCQTCQPPPDRV